MPVSAGIAGIGDLLASLAAPAVVDAGAAAATDVGLGAATDLGLGAAGSTLLPEIVVSGADAAAAGAPLDLLAGADLGAAGAGAAGAAGAGGLGDILGTGALGAGLGGLGSALSSVPGALGSLFVSPAAAAEAPSAAGAPTLGATGGGAPGAAPAAGGGLGGAGGSAASAAAPGNANDVVSSDFGALSFAPTAASSSPAGFPTTSPSGQSLAATAADPTTIASLGGGAGPTDFSTLGPGVSASGGTIGDNAPLTLGGGNTGLTSLFGSGALGNAGSWIAQNPLMAAALGLGGANILKQFLDPAKLPYQQQQEQIAQEALNNAGNLNTAGQEDLSYQQKGTLPPGMQAQVTQALNDAIAASNSKYASLGLGNSTMVLQEQQYLTLQSQALAGQLQQQLAQTGTQLISDATSDLSVSGNIYSSLMATQISQDTALETSVSQFAGSLALASVLGNKTAAKPAVTT